jgi:hypothetical protein
MEQSDSRHSTIATFNLDPFEVKIKFIYDIFFYQNIPITQKYLILTIIQYSLR